MSIVELVRRIGNTAELKVEDLRVSVVIADVKMAYGEPRYLVRPLQGSGEQWVTALRLKFQ